MSDTKTAAQTLHQIWDYQKEILRLRAALAEYANEDNWWIPEPDDYFPSFKTHTDAPWLLAREALRPLKPSHAE